MKAATGSAQARVGLLGNPSDGHGGRVIAFTFRERGARVRCVPMEGAAGISLHESGAILRASGARELSELLRAGAGNGGQRLLAAACLRFGQHAPEAIEAAARMGLALEFETDVPRQVGLAGSSAIVTAALRALARALALTLEALELAELSLRAETEELGIAAGPQDRVVQAFEGLLFMDFADSRPRVERLDARLLPPLYLAWQQAPGDPSGGAHADLLLRRERGDRDLRRAMATCAELADEGERCLQAGDYDRLRQVMDANYEARAAVLEVSASDRELVAIGRARGAGVKLTGSGGAVVGLPRAAGDFDALAAAYRAAGHAFLCPTVAAPACGAEVSER